MGPMTWRERLVYDLRHPITTLQRAMAYRYCRRFELVMVDPGNGDGTAAYRYLRLVRDADGE